MVSLSPESNLIGRSSLRYLADRYLANTCVVAAAAGTNVLRCIWRALRVFNCLVCYPAPSILFIRWKTMVKPVVSGGYKSSPANVVPNHPLPRRGHDHQIARPQARCNGVLENSNDIATPARRRLRRLRSNVICPCVRR